jgi:hypothetical protein
MLYSNRLHFFRTVSYEATFLVISEAITTFLRGSGFDLSPDFDPLLSLPDHCVS